MFVLFVLMYVTFCKLLANWTSQREGGGYRGPRAMPYSFLNGPSGSFSCPVYNTDTWDLDFKYHRNTLNVYMSAYIYIYVHVFMHIHVYVCSIYLFMSIYDWIPFILFFMSAFCLLCLLNYLQLCPYVSLTN